MKIFIIIIITLLSFFVFGATLWYLTQSHQVLDKIEHHQEYAASPTAALLSPSPTSMAISPSPTPPPSFIDHQPPFTSQAPRGQWDDPVFQDGCEEASVLMAIKWAKGESITSPEEATADIQAMSDFQEKQYGEFRDRSTADTAQMIKDYYNYPHISVVEDITINDIKDALYNKGVIIVPVAGRELNNPNFTFPGPLNHMLVIRGYDPDTKEFITNDPGTRNGEGFRYDQHVLYNAIRDYPTGYQEPNPGIKKKMIVVSR